MFLYPACNWRPLFWPPFFWSACSTSLASSPVQCSFRLLTKILMRNHENGRRIPGGGNIHISLYPYIYICKYTYIRIFAYCLRPEARAPKPKKQRRCARGEVRRVSPHSELPPATANKNSDFGGYNDLEFPYIHIYVWIYYSIKLLNKTARRLFTSRG